MSTLPADPLSAARRIRDELARLDLWHSDRSDGELPFRIALRPYELPADWRGELAGIGRDLYAFQGALNRLYREAARVPAFAFARAWLDQGKDELVRMYGGLNRLRRDLPVLIRPDLFRSGGRFVASEIDAVPGGFGIVAALQDLYEAEGYGVLGGRHGIVESFAAAMAGVAGRADPTVVIAVSDEADDYRREMTYLAEAARRRNHKVFTVHPREVEFREDGLHLPSVGRIDVLYRFFELFDLRNVPKSELFLYAAKKGTVRLTPPPKAYLEEKLAFALLHHPRLALFWAEALGDDAFQRLSALFPATWVVDHRPAPPQAFLYGLDIAGRPVGDFAELADLTQRERARWLLKPSGFSALAWGARGIRLGADLPAEAWREGVEAALAASRAGEPPWVLQAYHKPERTTVTYLDDAGRATAMDGRARLSPYYFVDGSGEVRLAGVLVTICPADKKLIHGMVDGVTAPAG
jgi:hypothetical protein